MIRFRRVEIVTFFPFNCGRSQFLKNLNIECIGVPTDVSVEKDCENLINKCIEEFGKIDVILNNAGISMRALFSDVDLFLREKGFVFHQFRPLVSRVIKPLLRNNDIKGQLSQW